MPTPPCCQPCQPPCHAGCAPQTIIGNPSVLRGPAGPQGPAGPIGPSLGSIVPYASGYMYNTLVSDLTSIAAVGFGSFALVSLALPQNLAATLNFIAPQDGVIQQITTAFVVGSSNSGQGTVHATLYAAPMGSVTYSPIFSATLLPGVNALTPQFTLLQSDSSPDIPLEKNTRLVFVVQAVPDAGTGTFAINGTFSASITLMPLA